MTISIKAIVPRANLPKRSGGKIRTLARSLFWREVHAYLEATVSSWENYPRFTQKGNSRVRVRGDEVTVEFFVPVVDFASRIWNWLEYGTAVRHYSFTDFQAKTEPDQLDAGDGQWKPKWYHPDQQGIEPRNWWKIIVTRIEANKSWHASRIEDAILDEGYYEWIMGRAQF